MGHAKNTAQQGIWRRLAAAIGCITADMPAAEGYGASAEAKPGGNGRDTHSKPAPSKGHPDVNRTNSPSANGDSPRGRCPAASPAGSGARCNGGPGAAAKIKWYIPVPPDSDDEEGDAGEGDALRAGYKVKHAGQGPQASGAGAKTRVEHAAPAGVTAPVHGGSKPAALRCGPVCTSGHNPDSVAVMPLRETGREVDGVAGSTAGGEDGDGEGAASGDNESAAAAPAGGSVGSPESSSCRESGSSDTLPAVCEGDCGGGCAGDGVCCRQGCREGCSTPCGVTPTESGSRDVAVAVAQGHRHDHGHCHAPTHAQSPRGHCDSLHGCFDSAGISEGGLPAAGAAQEPAAANRLVSTPPAPQESAAAAQAPRRQHEPLGAPQLGYTRTQPWRENASTTA